MTKEKFAFAFDHASFCIFGALICGLMSLTPLQYIDGADDRQLLACWFFFILFACGAVEFIIGVFITFRRGLKYYDEEQALKAARAKYYASRAPRRVLAVSAVAAVAAANPEGFTINAYTGETPAEGYAVALAETQDSHDAEGLARVLELIQSGTTRAAYVGGWLDNESGKYYYDATVVVNDRAAALALGRANKQLAIFDLTKQKVIRL